MTIRWLRDARIDARMHAQGLPLDMMLSVDRGSDAVELRVTTRRLTRDEARELGSRLIEAALLAGERSDVDRACTSVMLEPEPAPYNEHGWARGADGSDLSGGETDMPMIQLHGHVKPRPDEARARCGGPAICDQCRREANGEL